MSKKADKVDLLLGVNSIPLHVKVLCMLVSLYCVVKNCKIKMICIVFNQQIPSDLSYFSGKQLVSVDQGSQDQSWKHEAYLLFTVHLDGTLLDNTMAMKAKEFFSTSDVLQIHHINMKEESYLLHCVEL